MNLGFNAFITTEFFFIVCTNLLYQWKYIFYVISKEIILRVKFMRKIKSINFP